MAGRNLPLDKPTEQATQQRISDGDASSRLDVAQLVADHHEALYRYAYRLTGQSADAEDLTQQTFLIAQQKLSQLRQDDRARSWLFSVLRNCFLKSCRRQPPIPVASTALNINNVPENRPAGYPIDRRQLQEALDALPPEFRVVVLMFYFEGCSYKEIAQGLDLPIGTVMSRLARAKGRMRQSLFDDEEFEPARSDDGVDAAPSPPPAPREPTTTLRRKFDDEPDSVPTRPTPIRKVSPTRKDL
jgi:RNA polymerase sigma-70 factor (ECF subfamily)